MVHANDLQAFIAYPLTVMTSPPHAKVANAVRPLPLDKRPAHEAFFDHIITKP